MAKLVTVSRGERFTTDEFEGSFESLVGVSRGKNTDLSAKYTTIMADWIVSCKISNANLKKGHR